MSMNLKQWRENQWLSDHESSAEEVTELLAVIDRDLTDAAIRELSPDRRLGISYNAVLQLATLALAAEGYRTARGTLAHERALRSLAFTAKLPAASVDFLDAVRRKRNQTNYERAGTTSAAEAEEVFQAAKALRTGVLTWLLKSHKKLCPPGLKP
jgi:hypothetical protein